jgi:glycosyltransferase involved in cell wall biosynthesis
MNILMLNYEFPPIGGGAANAHYHILKEYSTFKDLNIDVLTSAPEPGLVFEPFGKNINIIKIGIHKKNLHFWRKLEVIEWLFKSRYYYRQLLEKKSYDVVHTFFGFPTGWLCYKTAVKVPYIISLRGSDVPGYNVRLGLDYKILAPLFKRIWSSAALIVANSEGLKELANKFMPGLDISIIPNGVDTDRFHPREEKTIGKRLKLLTVSRLIKRKRINLLIETLRELCELNVEAELNIAGEGALTQNLKSLASRLGVAEHVNFMGRIESEKMPQVYCDNDIFVMSSEHEGMCNAMLEAMASGLPIITTPCEGVEELITDNGIVVEQSTAESFATAITELANNSQVHLKMALDARKKAQQFSWRTVADRYIKCYHNVLNQKRN